MSGPPCSKTSVAAGAGRESRGALATLPCVQRRSAQLELAAQGGRQRRARAFVGRAAVAQYAAWWKGGDLRGERLGRRACLAVRHDAIGEPNALGFARVDGTARQDQI